MEEKPNRVIDETLDGEKYTREFMMEPFTVDGILYDPANTAIHLDAAMIELKCAAHYSGCGCHGGSESSSAYISVNNTAQPMGAKPRWVKGHESR